MTSVDARPMAYTLRARKLPVTSATVQGFVESDGYVAIEAADTTARTREGSDKNAMHWEELPGYGETRSAMSVFPVTATSDTDSKAALEYRMFLYDSGDFKLQATLAPTLNFVPGRGLRFAVSVDDGARTGVDEMEHNTQKDWEQAVSDGVRRVTVPLSIAAPGYHVVKIWAVDPGWFWSGLWFSMEHCGRVIWGRRKVFTPVLSVSRTPTRIQDDDCWTPGCAWMVSLARFLYL